MADRKISDLTALTTPATGDLIPIVDISEAAAADKNKSITVGELLRGAPDGTAAAPGFAFESDGGNGMFLGGTDILAFSTGGSQAVTIDASQRLGVGTSTVEDSTGSSTRLQIQATNGGSDVALRIKNNSTTDDTTSSIRFTSTTSAFDHGSIVAGRSPSPYLALQTNDGNTAIHIDTNQRVGIGTTSVQTKLHVVQDNSVAARIGGSSYYLDLGQYSASSSPAISYNGSGASLIIRNGTSEAARFDSSSRLLVGTSSAPNGTNTQYTKLGTFGNSSNNTASFLSVSYGTAATSLSAGTGIGRIFFGDTGAAEFASISAETDASTGSGDYPGRLVFATTADSASSPTERMRIASSGYVEIGNTQATTSYLLINTISNQNAIFNRTSTDGDLVLFRQDGTTEGTISVSGTTVSYNGAHLSRWSQLPGGAVREEILRGTVLSNIDEMCAWGEEDNEQLNRMKVSDVEGDPNVAGVFQAWDDDDDTYTDDFYCAMTGDFIIRIAEGVTVQRGDLLMSAGDGTAKPQDDDIIRSKTIAKVTSTHISETYADGSYCVPCVLMAC